jgi:hypothetical protein
VGSEDDPWTVARLLEHGVYQHIRKKNLGVAFATAAEVCRSREGDCTEHAVLLAALARARGIPSRVAIGVLYLGGIFGGHAWTEVWIDDGWYALDGTLGLGSVDAAHLRLASSSLAGLGMGPEMLGALAGLGNLTIEVVETEHDGRVRRYGEDNGPRPFSVEGRTLVSHDYGLRLTVPEGWSWEEDVPDWSSGVLARAAGPDGARLSLAARAVGYAFDLDGLSGEAELAPMKTTAAGRPARALLLEGTWTLAVLDGDTLFEVRWSPGSGAADDADALELLLSLAQGLAFDG